MTRIIYSHSQIVFFFSVTPRRTRPSVAATLCSIRRGFGLISLSAPNSPARTVWLDGWLGDWHGRLWPYVLRWCSYTRNVIANTVRDITIELLCWWAHVLRSWNRAYNTSCCVRFQMGPKPGCIVVSRIVALMGYNWRSAKWPTTELLNPIFSDGNCISNVFGVNSYDMYCNWKHPDNWKIRRKQY